LALVQCSDAECTDVCANDPCGSFPFEGHGYSCGQNLTASADPNALYLCNEGQTAGAVICADGCHVGALGEPDYCNDTDPCANSPYDGWACGSSLATPYAAGNLFYQCSDQRTVSTAVCEGCISAPPGSPDTCL
jgi:hypothetical protein